MSINQATISGNLTRDAELRNTAAGTPVLSFSVAVNDRRKNNQTGEWEDVPNFIDCTMFGSYAQAMSQYLTKGTKVAVQGKLHWSQWERDGQKRSKVDIIVATVDIMQRRDQGSSAAAGAPYTSNPNTYPPNGGGAAYAPPEGAVSQAAASIYDDDIPF